MCRIIGDGGSIELNAGGGQPGCPCRVRDSPRRDHQNAPGRSECLAFPGVSYQGSRADSMTGAGSFTACGASLRGGSRCRRGARCALQLSHCATTSSMPCARSGSSSRLRSRNGRASDGDACAAERGRVNERRPAASNTGATTITERMYSRSMKGARHGPRWWRWARISRRGTIRRETDAGDSRHRLHNSERNGTGLQRSRGQSGSKMSTRAARDRPGGSCSTRSKSR